MSESAPGVDQQYRTIVDAENGNLLMRQSLTDNAVDNPQWDVFPAWPQTTSMNQHPWNYPSADVRDLWCWFPAPGCQLEVGVSQFGPNTASRSSGTRTRRPTSRPSRRRATTPTPSSAGSAVARDPSRASTGPAGTPSARLATTATRGRTPGSRASATRPSSPATATTSTPPSRTSSPCTTGCTTSPTTWAGPSSAGTPSSSTTAPAPSTRTRCSGRRRPPRSAAGSPTTPAVTTPT